tara:strand:+ start:356 stop:541 length:186 start_codon:yes stop_codon:yes gene_type:complete
MKNFIEFTDYNTYKSIFVKKDMISSIESDDAICTIHVWPDKTFDVCEDLDCILKQLGEISK